MQFFVIKVVYENLPDIIQVLNIGCVPKYIFQHKKELVVHVIDVTIIARKLYKMGENEVL